MPERPTYLPELTRPRIPDFVPSAPTPDLDPHLSTRDDLMCVPVEKPHTVHPSSESTPPKEQQERVKFAGRLGAAPQYQQFENGNSRIRFPVGEHRDDGSTTWHKVYSTNRFAERIRDKELKKGDMVEVAGSRQERTEKDREGHDKPVTYIYAFGVTLR